MFLLDLFKSQLSPYTLSLQFTYILTVSIHFSRSSFSSTAVGGSKTTTRVITLHWNERLLRKDANKVTLGRMSPAPAKYVQELLIQLLEYASQYTGTIWIYLI